MYTDAQIHRYSYSQKVNQRQRCGFTQSLTRSLDYSHPYYLCFYSILHWFDFILAAFFWRGETFDSRVIGEYQSKLKFGAFWLHSQFSTFMQQLVCVRVCFGTKQHVLHAKKFLIFPNTNKLGVKYEKFIWN